MKQYKIGDKLECLEDIETVYFEMTNPYFVIPKGTIVTIIDAEICNPQSAWYLLEMNVSQRMKDLSPDTNFLKEKVTINAWNDEEPAHVDKYFKLI